MKNKLNRKLNLFVAFSICLTLTACGGESDGPDPIKKYYLESCSKEAPMTLCECLYDFGKEKLSEEEFLNSDLAFNYFEETGLQRPPISAESDENISTFVMSAFGHCSG